MSRILLCLLPFLIPIVTAQVKTPPPAPAPVEAAKPSAPEPIPLVQIAVRGEELARTLREISRRLPPEEPLLAFDEQLKYREELIQDSLSSSEDIEEGQATLMDIREQIREWRTFSLTESRDRKTLADWGAACQEGLTILDKARATWEATLQASTAQPEYAPVVPGIRSALKDIDNVKAEAERHIRFVLDLQSRLSRQALTVTDVIEKLTYARQHIHANLFHAEAPPIWQTTPQTSTDPLSSLVRRSLSASYSALILTMRQKSALVTGAILFLALVWATVYSFKQTIIGLGSSDPGVIRASQILARPFALVLLIAAPFVLLFYPLARMSTVVLSAQLFLIPITRLLPFYTARARVVYLGAVFFLVNGLLSLVKSDVVTRRYLLAIVFIVTICILGWWGRPGRFRGTAPAGTTPREILVIRWSVVVLALLLIANVAGFLLLSHILRLSLLVSCCFGFALYTLARVMGTLFAAAVRVPPVSSLASVRMYEAGLVKWVERILKVAVAACWTYVTLRLLELDQRVFEAIAAVLNATPGKALNFSLGDLLGFIAVLTIGYLCASGLRFVLREEILSRWRLSRGLPDTISTSCYYVVLLLVFFMSLSAAGIQLDKLTVLTGAFGVGIGFGLQNVVNNFVSGLILQFERPIRVGDILEVGTVSGEIRRIGVRSSTMRTFQGAEVIIPNSTLVSDRVVNWTLSESRRRIEIPVPVAYGTDPQRMLDMLLDIASHHEGVLREPAPSAVFKGFGDSSLDFLLMFWADQDIHFRLRSDVSISINNSLREAGIEIPFPQREVHVVPSSNPSAFRQSG